MGNKDIELYLELIRQYKVGKELGFSSAKVESELKQKIERLWEKIK